MSSRKFIALGTASQIPTRTRNHNGYFLRWGKEGILFDPGEGTQRQMLYAGVSASDITKICITHFHGDHCLGLPGILQRLSLDRVEHPVQVYFPASGERYFENLKEASIYYNTATIERHPIDVEGVVFSDEDFTLSCAKLDHTIDCFGYRLDEPNRIAMSKEKLVELGIAGPVVGQLKAEGFVRLGDRLIRLDQVSTVKTGESFAFVMDTRYCKGAVRLADQVDTLVAESTFLEEHAEEAERHGHLTARMAAKIASEASVGKLILTHFSQRYGVDGNFVGEARAVFSNAIAMNDGDSVNIGKRWVK